MCRVEPLVNGVYAAFLAGTSPKIRSFPGLANPINVAFVFLHTLRAKGQRYERMCSWKDVMER
jgi:hypothetical protein